MIRFLDPRAPTAIEATPYGLAIDLRGANACRVGFLANGFPDSEAFLEALEAALQARVPSLEPQRWNKGNASIPAPDAMLQEIEAGCDALIAAYGH